MTIILNQTLQERSKESLLSFFNTAQVKDLVIAIAESDKGVIANGGRLGSRWAAKAILSQLKRMAAPNDCPDIYLESLCHQNNDFHQARILQSQRLESLMNLSKGLLHLGGGHDHVYSLLKACKGPLLVINIDAHLDTRADAWSHSGNPFRDFAQDTKEDFQLFQLGIHPFANSLSTHQELAHGKMHILQRKDCDKEGLVKAYWNTILSHLKDEMTLIFSLDADAIASASLKAVSAPNHNGLSIAFLHQQIALYKDLCRQRSQKPIWGLYEYNPLYDDVSATNARVVSGIIYEMLLS